MTAAGPDPNWFFSTLSQSAAAVIGLIGGFLVSRLLQQSVAVKESKEQLMDDFLGFRRGLESRVSGLRAYRQWAEQKLPAMRSAVELGETSILLNQEVQFDGGSRGGDQSWEYAVSEDIVKEHETAVQITEPLAELYEDTLRLERLEDLPDKLPRYEAIASEIPENARSSHDGLQAQLRLLSHAIAAHRARALPPGSRFVLGLLAWLTVFGVIAPLAALSSGGGNRGSAKIALLTAFAIGALGLLVYLTRLMNDIVTEARLEVPEKYRLAA